MTIQSAVKAVMASASGLFSIATGYRLKTNNAWGSWLTCNAEITGVTIMEEWDEERRTTLKRQRASLKIYDTVTADAPVLRLGDEIRQDDIVWTISERNTSARAAGVYRYSLRRDIPLRTQADRQHLPIAEGGTVTATPSGETMAAFTATNVDVEDIFFGATVQRTSTGLVLASSATDGLDAIGMCTVAAAVDADATYITEGAFVTSDWTAIAGTALLTPGALYFQSATKGMITTTPPTTGNLQPIGTAANTTTLDLEIVEPIKL